VAYNGTASELEIKKAEIERHIRNQIPDRRFQLCLLPSSDNPLSYRVVALYREIRDPESKTIALSGDNATIIPCLISLGCQSRDGLTGDSQVVRKPGDFRLRLGQTPRGLIRRSGVLISGGRITTSRSACGSAVDRSNISIGDDILLGETQLLLQPLQTLLGDRVRGNSISQLSLLIPDPRVKLVDLRSSKAHLLKEMIVALSKVVPLEKDVIESRLQIVDLPSLI
ncbi:hypothetical protein PC110_g23548, partial [Phytophthora cactorum]